MNEHEENACKHEQNHGECKCDHNHEHGECKCTHEHEHGECGCGEGHECGCEHEHADKSAEYLDMARRLQAEFENFRKRTFFDIKKAREDGEIAVIEAFLPALDTFKVAKKSISDEKVLEGVEMIENNIFEALKKLGVSKIESVGVKYDPDLHNVIALSKDAGKDDDIILDEFQAGYKYKDRVIRYSKVIVNKKED